MEFNAKSEGKCSCCGSHVVLSCLGLWAVLNMEAQRQVVVHTASLLTNQTKLESPPKSSKDVEIPKYKNLSFVPLNLEACFQMTESQLKMSNETLVPSLSKYLNYNGSEILLVGAYDWGYGLLQIPAVIMIVSCCGAKCRWPCAEITLAIGQVVAALATIVMPFVDMVPLVAAIGVRFLAGAGGACCLPMLYSVLSKYHPKGHTTVWLCLSLAGVPLGMNLAHSLTRVCAEELKQPKLAFFILGGTGLLWQAMWIMFTKCQSCINNTKNEPKQEYQKLTFCKVVKTRTVLVTVIAHITAVYTQVLLTTRGHHFIHLHPQRDYIVSVTYFCEGALLLISALVSHRLCQLEKWSLTFLRKSSELIGRMMIVSVLIAMSITNTVDCSSWQGTVMMWMIATIAQGLLYTGYLMTPLDNYPGHVGIIMATMGTMEAVVRVALFHTQALQRPLLIVAINGGPDIALYVCVAVIGVSTVIFVKCGSSEALDLQDVQVPPVTDKQHHFSNGPELLNRMQDGQGHTQGQGRSVTFASGDPSDVDGRTSQNVYLQNEGDKEPLLEPKVPCEECKPTHVCETLPKVRRARHPSHTSITSESRSRKESVGSLVGGSRPSSVMCVPCPGEWDIRPPSPIPALEPGHHGGSRRVSQTTVGDVVSGEWNRRSSDALGPPPPLPPSPYRGRRLSEYRPPIDQPPSDNYSNTNLVTEMEDAWSNMQSSPASRRSSRY